MKKRVLPLLTALALCLGLTVTAQAAFGYINKTGALAIPVRFQEAKEFSDGIARVRLDGNGIYIDTTGVGICSRGFISINHMSDFNDGMAVAAIKVMGAGPNGNTTHYIVIDNNGKFVVPQDWSSGGSFTYYKLRDLGAALGFTVGWSAERGVFFRQIMSAAVSNIFDVHQYAFKIFPCIRQKFARKSTYLSYCEQALKNRRQNVCSAAGFLPFPGQPVARLPGPAL